MSATEWKNNRLNCIRTLRLLADKLDTMQGHYNNSKLASKALTGLGTAASGGLFIASFFTAGITLLPAIIVGASTSGTGLVVRGGAYIGKKIHENELLKDAQEACRLDHELSKVLEKKASNQNIKSMRRVNSTIKGVTTGLEIGVNVFKFAKIAKVVRIGGGILNILMLPIDIIDIVVTAIKNQEGKTHEASAHLREIALGMERELRGIDCDF